jgi:hypothetical protein
VTRRALLVGAQAFGLTGVENDVAAMTTALEAREFDDIRLLIGSAATRDGILAAYEQLIRVSGTDDTVVVFYSGHGDRILHPDGPDGPDLWPGRMDMQYILPTDFDPSLADGFRGIAAVELSVLLARLTDVTHNVTAIFDCCHSALMSRDPDLRVKAYKGLYRHGDPAAYATIARHLRERVDGGLDLRRPDVVSNPHAVRVVACSPEQTAWERPNADRVQMGLLTDALTRVLAEAGDAPLSWSVVIQRVRERVHARTMFQRPGAEGPSRRIPFTTVEAESAATLPVLGLDGGYVELLGAPLLGIRAGDEFAIETPMPGTASTVTAVGDTTVDHLTAMSATGPVRFADGWKAVPLHSRARRTKAVAPAMPVRVAGADPSTPGLLTALTGSTLIRPAGPDEDAEIGVHRTADGRLVVEDRWGRLHEPVYADAGGVRRIVDNLHLTARAAALRTIEDDPFVHRVTLTWGRVARGRPEPVDREVHVGDHLWFRACNEGPGTVHVSLLDIGLSGRVSLLTGHLQSGMMLAAGTDETLGFDSRIGRLVGLPLSWPDALPVVAARPETVLVVVSEAPVDVSVLQQDGTRSRPERTTVGSPLERLLAQIVTGATRDITPPTPTGTRYAVRAIDLQVRSDPRP